MEKLPPLRIIVAACSLLLVMLVAGLIGGAAFEPDADAIRAFQSWRGSSPLLTTTAIWITHAGSAPVTIGLGLATALWLKLSGHGRRAAILAAVTIGERLVLDGLKYILERPRPSFDAHPVLTHSSSFPSGHSGNTMAVFLAIALIAVPQRWRRQAVAIALGASLLIGLTRPYLGVHWPSDVVGGWSLGATMAILGAYWAGSVAPEQQHQIVGRHDAPLGKG